MPSLPWTAEEPLQYVGGVAPPPHSWKGVWGRRGHPYPKVYFRPTPQIKTKLIMAPVHVTMVTNWCWTLFTGQRSVQIALGPGRGWSHAFSVSSLAGKPPRIDDLRPGPLARVYVGVHCGGYVGDRYIHALGESSDEDDEGEESEEEKDDGGGKGKKGKGSKKGKGGTKTKGGKKVKENKKPGGKKGKKEKKEKKKKEKKNKPEEWVDKKKKKNKDHEEL